VLLGSRSVPALAAGATSSGVTSVTIPAGTATGVYYAIAKADADGAVGETQEGNNTSLTTIQVGPDLAIALFTAPFTTGAGATISVSDTTKNQGGGMAGASTTRFYLSTNTILDASDVLLGSRAVPALAVGATSSATTSLTIPAGTGTGNYYLIAQVDGNGAVPETQEANNTNARLIQIGADLTIAIFTAPFSATAGATISVSDTTKNQGGGAAGPSATKFYLSTNSTLDGVDVLLGSRAVPALAAGAQDSGTTVLTIPAGTAAGYHYLIAQVDGDGAVPETQEGNNTNARFIQISAP
jgi:subtilase family serine protease